MRTRRHRREALDLARRANVLPPEQRGTFLAVMLGYALITGALQTVLLVVCARGGRRAVKARQNGPRAMAHAALTRSVIATICGYGVYRAASKVLLLRWGSRFVQRTEDRVRGRAEPSGAS